MVPLRRRELEGDRRSDGGGRDARARHGNLPLGLNLFAGSFPSSPYLVWKLLLEQTYLIDSLIAWPND